MWIHIEILGYDQYLFLLSPLNLYVCTHSMSIGGVYFGWSTARIESTNQSLTNCHDKGGNWGKSREKAL
jgi:hypothetical protein